MEMIVGEEEAAEEQEEEEEAEEAEEEEKAEESEEHGLEGTGEEGRNTTTWRHTGHAGLCRSTIHLRAQETHTGWRHGQRRLVVGR